MKSWLPVLLIALFLGSCTIEKRLYNNGYHVEFRQHSGKIREKNEDVNPIVNNETIQGEILSATADAEVMDTAAPALNGSSELLSPFVKEIAMQRLKSLQSIRRGEERKTPEIKRIAEQRSPVRLKSLPVKRFAESKQGHSRGGQEMSEEAVEMLLGAIALLILLLCFVYPTFAAIVQLIIAIVSLALVAFCVVWVIVWLCSADFGNFPWFWSGR